MQTTFSQGGETYIFTKRIFPLMVVKGYLILLCLVLKKKKSQDFALFCTNVLYCIVRPFCHRQLRAFLFKCGGPIFFLRGVSRLLQLSTLVNCYFFFFEGVAKKIVLCVGGFVFPIQGFKESFSGFKHFYLEA